MTSQKPGMPLRTALFYALFAGLWILFSDQILLLFVDDLSQHSTLQTFKGWFFVVVSALLLYIHLQRELNAQRERSKAFRSNAQQLQLVYESISDVIFLLSVEPNGRYRFVSVNNAFLRTTGLESEQVIGRYADEVLPASAQKLVFSNYKKAIEERSPVTWEDVSVYPSGTTTAVITVNAIFDEAGNCTHLVGGVHDLTELKRVEQELRASNERFQQLAENISEVFWITDPQLKKDLYLSPAYEEIWGRPVQGQLENVETFIECVVPEDRGMVLLTIEKQERGEKTEMEYRIVRPDGSIRWIWDRAFPILNERGQVIRVAGIASDITERKDAEIERRALLEIAEGTASSKDLHELLGLIHRSIARVIFAENFFVILHNPKTDLFEEVYSVDQYDPPSLPFKLEKSISAYVYRTGEPLLVTQERFDELVKQGEMELIGTNSPSWLGVPLKVSGETIGVMVVQDYDRADRYSERDRDFLFSIASQIALTVQRRQAEEALKNSESRFRALIENGLDNISLLAVDGTLLWESPATVRMLGYQPDEFVGRDMFSLVHPDDLDWMREIYGEILQAPGSRQHRSFRLRHADGTWRWAEAIVTNLLNEPSVNALVVNYRDVTDRKQAEMEITRLLAESQRRLKQLEALHSIDLAISASMDLRTTLSVLIQQVESLLNVDAVDILLFNPDLQQFTFSAGRGFLSDEIQRVRIRYGKSFAGRVVFERKRVLVSGEHAMQAEPAFSDIYEREGFLAYAGVPLMAKGQIKGVMEVYHRSPFSPDPEWLNFFETLAGQAAIAVESAQLLDGLQRSNIELAFAYDQTIAGWSHAMDLRDKETEGHTQRVTDLTLKLARVMNFNESQLIHVQRGALLHDIGKMGVPDNILLKADKLTAEEWEKMRQHPEFAYQMLASIQYLKPALDIPYCHHEKWDGTGYPRALKGEEIPLAARIFAVVDVWDAVTNDRPYRAAWTQAQALEYIREQSGKHFDPQVVDIFLRLMASS
ncbi:MAG TPA: PAS domain S-box protein [Anaerolineales bacterium]|nr:PAS domain S-box protein [Anaerolineales bacterium]